MHWRRKWQPTPVFLPGESQGWGSLVGCRLWGRTESDETEATEQQQQQQSSSRVHSAVVLSWPLGCSDHCAILSMHTVLDLYAFTSWTILITLNILVQHLKWTPPFKKIFQAFEDVQKNNIKTTTRFNKCFYCSIFASEYSLPKHTHTHRLWFWGLILVKTRLCLRSYKGNHFP